MKLELKHLASYLPYGLKFTLNYTVSFLYSLKNHLEHWDNLILTKQHLK